SRSGSATGSWASARAGAIRTGRGNRWRRASCLPTWPIRARWRSRFSASAERPGASTARSGTPTGHACGDEMRHRGCPAPPLRQYWIERTAARPGGEDAMAALVILIPAAGASRRMRGADKLLEDVDDEPVLRRTARIAAEVAPVLVTLPDTGPLAPARRAALAGLAARILPVADAHEGMAASLRAGAREIGAAEGMMILMPDMPDVTAEDLHRLAVAFAADPT